MATNFSPEFADKLLDRLSNDDAFRAAFQKDPRSALQQLGYETPKEDFGIKGSDPVLCCLGDGLSLASKEDIAAARKTLRSQLSGSVFHYDVTRVEIQAASAARRTFIRAATDGGPSLGRPGAEEGGEMLARLPILSQLVRKLGRAEQSQVAFNDVGGGPAAQAIPFAIGAAAFRRQPLRLRQGGAHVARLRVSAHQYRMGEVWFPLVLAAARQ